VVGYCWGWSVIYVLDSFIIDSFRELMLVKSSFFEIINVIIKKERMRFKTISF
jgi:hypothetical protein